MREIQLTRGLVALVDDDDHEWLSQWKWYALEGNNGRFYAGRGIRIDGRRTHLSMQSALMQPGPGCEVDHEDGNGLNNQRSNLRSATRAENQWNVRLRRDNTSGVKGVTWDRQAGKWLVRIRVNGKRINLGHFGDLDDAAAAYAEAALVYHGDFARIEN